MLEEKNKEIIGTRLIAPDVDITGVPDLYGLNRIVRSKKRLQRLIEVRTLFYVQKWTVREIAAGLGLTERAVFKHLATLRTVYSKIVASDAGIVADVNKFLLQLMGSYEERIKKLWEHHRAADGPVDKSNIIKEIGAQERQYIVTLQSLGYLPKAADHKYTASIKYVSHLGKKDLTTGEKQSTNKNEDITSAEIEVEKEEKGGENGEEV